MSDDPSGWPFMGALAAMGLFLCEWTILGLLRRRHDSERRSIEACREARGLKLLREWLSPEQLRSFDGNGHFDVVGNDTSSVYRVRHGTAVNIEEIGRDGRTVCAWCVVPEGNLVAGDVVLAQKIALETDERATLSVAIRYERIQNRWMA